MQDFLSGKPPNPDFTKQPPPRIVGEDVEEPAGWSRFAARAERIRDAEASRLEKAKRFDLAKFTKMEERLQQLRAAARDLSERRLETRAELQQVRDRRTFLEKTAKPFPPEAVDGALLSREPWLSERLAALEREYAELTQRVTQLGQLVENCRRYLKDEGVLP